VLSPSGVVEAVAGDSRLVPPDDGHLAPVKPEPTAGAVCCAAAARASSPARCREWGKTVNVRSFRTLAIAKVTDAWPTSTLKGCVTITPMQTAAAKRWKLRGEGTLGGLFSRADFSCEWRPHREHLKGGTRNSPRVLS
jgi:hypothetical protein